jgi:IS5 family transposase
MIRAIEPVIGHMKTEGHLGRCHLKGRDGDAANVILTAVGHNLRGVLVWLRALLRERRPSSGWMAPRTPRF